MLHYNTKGMNFVSFLISRQCIFLICFHSFFMFHFCICGVMSVCVCMCCMYIEIYTWKFKTRLKSGIICHLSSTLYIAAGSLNHTENSEIACLCLPRLELQADHHASWLLHGFWDPDFCFWHLYGNCSNHFFPAIHLVLIEIQFLNLLFYLKSVLLLEFS